MGLRAGVSFFAFLSMVVTACGPGAGGLRPASESPGTPNPNDTRALVIGLKYEPAILVEPALNVAKHNTKAPYLLFHAALSHYDEKFTPHAQLAEALPQFGSDSWTVFPDGRMETTWRLRPSLTWHDGAPLVADDFLFSLQARIALQTTGGATTGGAKLGTMIDTIATPDPGTLVIRWKVSNPFAGELEVQPLPRHILGQLFEQMPGDTFFQLPYFTTEFVGAGPYRLERWERGAFIEGVAFPGYTYGKPTIQRIKIVWLADANAAVVNLIAGSVDFLTDESLAFEQAPVLRQQWASRGEAGSLLLSVAKVRVVQIQYKTEYTNPLAILDLRVRQAFAHAIDRQALVDGMLDGEPGMAETFVSPQAEYYAEVDKVITKHPLDLRRTEQLMTDAGFRKVAADFYSQDGTRVSTPIQVEVGSDVAVGLILADNWKRAGFDAPLRILSTIEAEDREIASTYPAFRVTNKVPENLFQGLITTDLALSPRWLGNNKGGYVDPEIDRLSDIYYTSLDRKARNQAVVEGSRLLSAQAVSFPLYFAYQVVAHGGNLVGPRTGAENQSMYKVDEWHWR